jgi:hypothetical protein
MQGPHRPESIMKWKEIEAFSCPFPLDHHLRQFVIFRD